MYSSTNSFNYKGFFNRQLAYFRGRILNRWPDFGLVAFLLFCFAAFARIYLAFIPGLWADEIFSLAMATGHSLEHPATDARPTTGDYIEPPLDQSAESFKKYLRHESPPAGAKRVIRAVILSDTNPPLYYLLLNIWTRLTGTSDAALRLFSAMWALACFPLIWFVGIRVGGKKMAFITCILFSLSPSALYYSAEGRMYSLIWFLGLALVWSSLTLTHSGAKPHKIFLWSIIAAAGLLTHYFFVFVVTANIIWLMFFPGKSLRIHFLVAISLAVAIALPWYIHIPGSLDRWRVTADWRNYSLTWKQVLRAPFYLAWSIFSGYGPWGGLKWVDRLGAGIYLAVIILTFRKGIWALLSQKVQLLCLWALGACLGPLAFDLLQNTNVSLIARYALTGLPAGLLLAGMLMSLLPRKTCVLFLLLIIFIWLPGIRGVFSMPSRPWEPYPEISKHIATKTALSDLIIVHSIPSGVLGVARYLKNSTRLASWVVQLEQRRIPDDMNKLAGYRCCIILIKVHHLERLSPAEKWLRQNAKLEGYEVFLYPKRMRIDSPAEILFFRLEKECTKNQLSNSDQFLKCFEEKEKL
jgi:hypothetical protein